MFLQELRHALRSLARKPTFTVIAVLTLALGIGANCAIFSVVNGILWKPLPAHDPGQLAVLAFQQRGAGSFASINPAFSPADLHDIQQQSGVLFDALAGYTASLDGLSYHGRAERVMVSYVTGNYFSMLDMQPAAGRLLLPREGAVAGADPVIVLGNKYWQTHFAGDRGIVGQTVEIDGHPITVVGVAPAGFNGTFALADSDAYMPLAMAETTEPFAFTPTFMTDRNQRFMLVMGRLRRGVSLGRAQAALALVGDRLAQAYPKTDRGMFIAAYHETDARPGPDPNRTFQKISALFLALAGLVLLLACANVANLLLVQATGRVRELAVRAALGASRLRLIRQMLLESVLLGLAGGAGGLLVGVWASHALAGLNFQTSLPVNLNFSLDWRVFFYALGAAVASGIIAGVVPALRASRLNLEQVLHASGRSVTGGRSWLRSTLVVAQVAGSLALLIVAGLFVRSLEQAQNAHLGFDPNQVMNLSVDPNEVGLSQAQGLEFYRALLSQVRRLPGVTAAGAAFGVPMGYLNGGDRITVAGYTLPAGEPAPTISINFSTPGIFAALRMPVVEGRDFTDSDQENTLPVAVVNQAMVKKFWPHEDPLGRTFTMASDPKHTWHVVGVVADSKQTSLGSVISPYIYVPVEQSYISMLTLQIRTEGPPEAVARPVEAIIHQLSPGMPVVDVQTQLQAMAGFNGFMIFQLGAELAGALGLLGLVLAVVGVYGIVSYTTAQRTHEIGMRLALGARRSNILGLVLRQGGLLVGAGMVVGLAVALGLGHAAANFLVGVGGADPLTFVSVTAVLAAAAFVACLLPARRATTVDPAVALREE